MRNMIRYVIVIAAVGLLAACSSEVTDTFEQSKESAVGSSTTIKVAGMMKIQGIT